MAADEQLDRLSRELSKQSLGPIDTLFSHTIARVGTAATSIVAWLQRVGYDRPLITLLLSFQVGYMFARLGRRYARH